MANKGVVMDFPEEGSQDVRYSLSPPIVGFFELTMMKLGTLVHPGSLSERERPQISRWEDAVRLIRDATVVAVSDCYCRHKAGHLNQACDAPGSVCLSLDQFGEFVVRRGFGRLLSKDEAIGILEQCRNANLVHVVDNVKNKPVWLCNCCSCCCGVCSSGCPRFAAYFFADGKDGRNPRMAASQKQNR